MPSAKLAATVFAALTGVVALFQLALALGAPWGEYAMGGAFPGTYPPAMRVAAVGQIVILAGFAAVVLARAGLMLRGWRWARVLAWIVAGLMGVGVLLNLITPSGMERLIWAPVAVLLFLCAVRVAVDK